MEVNELRLGNLVMVDNPNYHSKLKNIVLEVTGISQILDRENKPTHSISLCPINLKPNKYYETYNQFIKFIEPIELTEEWLIKFGFEFKKTDHANSYKFDNFRFNFVFDGKLKGNVFLNFGNLSFKNYINSIPKLQNLYFALTGEELTIK